MKVTKRILMTLLTLVVFTGAWAIDTDSDGTYIISSVQDWNDFATGLSNNTITTTANAKLIKDITVTTMNGYDGKKYAGIFDGGNHTITVNISGTVDCVAPFRYINGAIIKNLKVEGTVNGAIHCAGLVGGSYGNSTISNVFVNVAVTTTGTHCGGILGHGQDSYTTIEASVFTGSITGASSGSIVGVICGWNHGGMVTINNCIEAGSSYTNCSTFNPIFYGSSGKSVINSFYLTPKNAGDNLGTQLSASVPDGEMCGTKEVLGSTYYIPVAVSGVDEKYGLNEGAVTPEPVVTLLGNTLVKGTDYTVSYSNNTSPGTASVIITGKGKYSGVKTVNFRIVGIALSGHGTEDSPYLITSDDDWTSFVTSLNDFDFSGKYLKLTKDINISAFAGYRENNPFSGIFDGNGHTMTASITSTATGITGNDVGVAPFHFINNATIKNLRVAGTINTQSYHASGLVGVAYGRNQIINCVVSATIITNTSYVGGIVGHGYDSNTTVQDCLFNGRIEGGRYIGAIWGHSHGGTGTIINCLENGTYSIDVSYIDPIYRAEGGTITCTNDYYVTNSQSGSTKVTTEQLANGTVAVSLGNAWVQDPITNLPLPKIFVQGNGISTGIDSGQRSKGLGQRDGWYSIDGRKLNGKPAKKGIYINNGNKVVIK